MASCIGASDGGPTRFPRTEATAAQRLSIEKSSHSETAFVIFTIFGTRANRLLQPRRTIRLCDFLAYSQVAEGHKVYAYLRARDCR